MSLVFSRNETYGFLLQYGPSSLPRFDRYELGKIIQKLLTRVDDYFIIRSQHKAPQKRNLRRPALSLFGEKPLEIPLPAQV